MRPNSLAISITEKLLDAYNQRTLAKEHCANITLRSPLAVTRGDFGKKNSARFRKGAVRDTPVILIERLLPCFATVFSSWHR